jgi:cellulose synthase/poly-beta-1,6-N-acetylglucosamine synthase-like glycosyltransferase
MAGKNKISNKNGNHLNGNGLSRNGNGFSKNGKGNDSKRTEHDGGNPLKPLGSTAQGSTVGNVMAKIGEILKNIFLNLVSKIANFGWFSRSKSALSLETLHKQENGNRSNGKNSNGNNHQHFVSIHLPFYNEKNVADRILKACTSLDYENYEVIVADDSIDETVEILKKWEDHPKVKVTHRESRKGWKGGALNEALKRMDPRAEYVMVFDADFVPPSDIIQQFLPYFGNNTNGNHNGNNGNNHLNGNHSNGNNGTVSKDEYQRIIEKLEQWYEKRELAVVQGYQWHYLNAGENWLTKGIRAEYSSSYVIERTSQELIGSMKMIAGSVFMIKADIIKKHTWSTSMTEDWELTLRLYLDGYKVSYTPYIQAPAECPSTIPQLAKQRMRWAEGHTFNAKKYFWEVLRSPKISTREKLEFAYYAPYYLQSFIFLIGTFFWFLSETMHQYLPFWTQVFGWSLLLSNLLALPFMGLVGLFLERNVRRDFAGILSFIVMSYILVPFQAYASLKGLLEKKEGGTWIRTLKTGKITEALTKLRLGRVWRELMPRRKEKKGKAKKVVTETNGGKPTVDGKDEESNVKGVKSAEDERGLSRHSWLRRKKRGKAALALLIVTTSLIMSLFALGTRMAVVEAGSPATLYFHGNSPGTMDTNVGTSTLQSSFSAATTFTFDRTTNPTSTDESTTADLYVYMKKSGGGSPSFTVSYVIKRLDTLAQLVSYGPSPSQSLYGNFRQYGPFTSVSFTIPAGKGIRIEITFTPSGGTAVFEWDGPSGTADSRLVLPTSNIPENALFMILLAPLIPLYLAKRKTKALSGEHA